MIMPKKIRKIVSQLKTELNQIFVTIDNQTIERKRKITSKDLLFCKMISRINFCMRIHFQLNDFTLC